MNSLHCLTCGGARIEVGEAGRPSQCADCGGTNLAGVYACRDFKVLEQHTPLESSFKVIKCASCDPAKARALFAEMHAQVEAA